MGKGFFANLAARKDEKRDLEETFLYDKLDRLTRVCLNGHPLGATSYDAYGRMLDKRSDGQAVFDKADYGGAKPHALKTALAQDGLLPSSPQGITYTMFDKVSSIAQDDKTLTYRYGFDHQRITSTLTGNDIFKKKTYVGNCEFLDIPPVSDNIRRTFLAGPLGVFAVVETINEHTHLHYILKDHLGSWTTVTDNDGQVEQTLSFDAWGNLRNPDTWSGSFSGIPKFDRGFTGHEHLYSFGLINSNGRMYDPTFSCFLSPDNYIQSPDFSQSFNRYAYCLNNPLKYVDPSGDFFTWSINQHGFSVGMNFTPAAVPLGFGVNVSWADGGSVGLYGEAAYRVGGTGLGAGAGVQQSIDFNFNSGWSTSSSVFAYASYACFTAGGSAGYNWTGGSPFWGVNGGIGFGRSDGNLGGGLSVGYGSGGWTFGANGYYNRMQKPVTTYGETVSVASEDIPAIKQQYADDCLETVLRWQESTGFGAEVLTDQQLALCLVAGNGDFGGTWFGKSSLNYQKAKQCGFAYYEEGKASNTILDEAFIKMKNQNGRVIINEATATGGHSVGIKSITEMKHTNIWGRTTSGYRVVVMDPFYGQYRVEPHYNIISSKGLSIFFY